jgi:8-hydroxy-5-deazaflavin:NADPH oxidoreductase
MKIAVLGTGMVGETLASKLVELGHDVRMGSRSATNEKVLAWTKKAGVRGSGGTFADAAAFGEMVFVCTNGANTLDALKAAGAGALAGKVVVDITNPLDFSKGMPPSLTVPSTDSLGEQIQRAFPDAKVVKTLNTMNCNLMVSPRTLPQSHVVFVSGNDGPAKASVKKILESFGWKNEEMIDLGDIATARGTEHYLPLWLRMYGALGTGTFNIAIVKAS